MKRSSWCEYATDYSNQTDSICYQTLNVLNDIVVIFNPERELSTCNQACKNNFTVQRKGEGIITCNDLFNWQIACEHCPIKQALTSNDPVIAELFDYQNGTYYQCTATLIKQQRSDLVETFVSVILHDITAQRNYEAHISKINRDLERTSSLRTTIFSNMSHELRTPLTAIVGFSQLIMENPAMPDVRDMAELIYTGGRKLTRIINNIITFVDAQADQVNMSMDPVNLKSVIELLMIQLKGMSNKKNIQFSLEWDDDIPPVVYTDEHFLDQIFFQLGDNALKFTDKGCIHIAAQLLDRKAKNEIDVGFYFSDTGCGVDPDHIDNIFESFYQQNSSYNRSFDGLGIGLAIASKLVSKMGGRIQCEKTTTEGTTFGVFLPFVVCPKTRKRLILD
ncbi:MAG: HAMP domain-containing histidine kinase [Spartobacteria bacterium]|nr:HAMP domain-containing histidine kinase [Spartobacteria bacterium]